MEPRKNVKTLGSLLKRKNISDRGGNRDRGESDGGKGATNDHAHDHAQSQRDDRTEKVDVKEEGDGGGDGDVGNIL